MLLEGLPAWRVTALVESPDRTRYEGVSYNFKTEGAITFGVTARGDIYSASNDDAFELSPDDQHYVTHRDLLHRDFGAHLGPSPHGVYEWSGRAWETDDGTLLFSFWQEPPIAEIRRIVKSVKENYWGSQPYPVMYQTPRHDRNDGWLSLDDEDTSPEPSREEKKLRELEYQLHTATPDQKAFIRKGIAIARQKIEQERESDDKLLAALGEA